MIDLEQRTNELGLHCDALISDFHCFNSLDSYIELIKNFLNYNIDAETFETNFYEMRRLDSQKEYKWAIMLYTIDNLKLKQFQGLSSILSKLFTNLDVFESNPLLRDNYEIGKKELRYFAKEALSKIKTYNNS